ncbi:MAG TPA: PQQ-dependent sugar dehydrogenase [Casimicrobiaceae bacterium]|nr:PQQ-dependent sugar dehydrogenase [Casimicrobiaceae bacterium]
MRASRCALALVASLTLSTALAQAPKSPTPAAVDAPIRAVQFATGLQNPWGAAFLPDGRVLVTERPGRLRIVERDGRVSSPLRGVPEVVALGQGGLLDVALSPQFASDKLVYLSYSEPGEGGAGTAVARGRLDSDALANVEVIWRQTPKVTGPNHWGSRLAFARDGRLFITTGDRFTHRERAQDVATTIGKVIRIEADGKIPSDNPFVKREGARPEIWSYGHRNVQAAALDPSTGRLWTVEHGARGGDELNSPEAGRNYGWPVITYGVNYSGAKIGEGTAQPGMEQPVYYWDPVIAPSGAHFYTGDAYPSWRGSLFVGSLTPGGLVRLEIAGGRVRKEERYLRDVGRVRDVLQGPDGLLYLLIDARDGGIVRIEPAK